MTDKTITLARELVERIVKTCPFTLLELDYQELRAALAEPVPPAVDPLNTPERLVEDGLIGPGVLYRDVPVPPAGVDLVECDACPTSGGCVGKCMKAPVGGDVGALIDQLDDYIARINGDDRGSDATVNELRGHVTRLQAEVERQKARDLGVKLEVFEVVCKERDALQSELTQKAEALDVAKGMLQERVKQCTTLQAELTKARELLHRSEPWLRKLNEESQNGVSAFTAVSEYLSNQSAPADKGQGEPVAWLNVATGEFTTCPVVVMDWDDEKEQVQSLYAEQPAPVAVAICKHCGWPHINDAESCDHATKRERGKP